MKKRFPKSDPINRAHLGFTLIEVMMATTFFSILLLTVVSLLISMLRVSQSVIGASLVSVDAANAVQRVSMSLREAHSIQLMDGGTFGSNYNATDENGNIVAVTGVRMFFPVTNPSVTINTVPNGSPITLSGENALYDRTQTGATLDFYRSDKEGTPNPNTGTYLWMSGTENGVTVSRAIAKNIASTRNAVQFIQPYLSDGVTPIPNEVKVKIVCSVYDRIHGTSTSESTAGTQVQLTGETVYLRDHNPNGAYSTGVHGHTQN